MVTDAPGLFDDIGHAHRAVNHPPFREKFGNLGAKKGFVAGYLWACGDTSIATLEPFKKLDDLKGKKIRVLATPLERAFISKLGATGVPMPYTEVLPAMQQRVIDGVRQRGHRDVSVEVPHGRQAHHVHRHGADNLRPVPQQCLAQEAAQRSA